MKQKGPGKWFRKGITLIEVIAIFRDDESAEKWFASMRWTDGPVCPFCRGSSVQSGTAHPSMPYRCRGCGRRFSVRTGSVMADTKLGYRTRAVALFLLTTGIKGVSSMKSGTPAASTCAGQRMRTASNRLGPCSSAACTEPITG